MLQIFAFNLLFKRLIAVIRRPSPSNQVGCHLARDKVDFRSSFSISSGCFSTNSGVPWNISDIFSLTSKRSQRNGGTFAEEQNERLSNQRGIMMWTIAELRWDLFCQVGWPLCQHGGDFTWPWWSPHGVDPIGGSANVFIVSCILVLVICLGRWGLCRVTLVPVLPPTRNKNSFSFSSIFWPNLQIFHTDLWLIVTLFRVESPRRSLMAALQSAGHWIFSQ